MYSLLLTTASIAQLSDSLLFNRKYISFVTAKISLSTSVHTQYQYTLFFVHRWGEIMAIQYSVNNIKILHTHFLRLQAASARCIYRQRDDSHIIRFHYPGKSGETMIWSHYRDVWPPLSSIAQEQCSRAAVCLVQSTFRSRDSEMRHSWSMNNNGSVGYVSEAASYIISSDIYSSSARITFQIHPASFCLHHSLNLCLFHVWIQTRGVCSAVSSPSLFG